MGAISAWIKRACGGIFSGKPELEELSLKRDGEELEKLLAGEEWPFLLSDLEVSHRQPDATGFVARKDGQFAGFFATHAFGEVGYLDMMIIARDFRKRGIARPLYFHTIRELKAKGIKPLVVHTTNDSSRLIRLLGFKAGQSFTLLARPPGAPEARDTAKKIVPLPPEAQLEVVTLDAEVFGVARPEWIRALMDQETTKFFGVKQDGRLATSACLRARRGDAVCLDLVNGRDFQEVRDLVDNILGSHRDVRIECFARTDSDLFRHLKQNGFTVPDFFKPIGPLVEWRKGRSAGIGTSDRTRTLSWF